MSSDLSELILVYRKKNRRNISISSERRSTLGVEVGYRRADFERVKVPACTRVEFLALGVWIGGPRLVSRSPVPPLPNGTAHFGGSRGPHSSGLPQKLWAVRGVHFGAPARSDRLAVSSGPLAERHSLRAILRFFVHLRLGFLGSRVNRLPLKNPSTATR